MRGIGYNQQNLKRLTISKIVTTLASKPQTYEQMRKNTGIQRNNLRRRLDYLIIEGIVIRHKYTAHSGSLASAHYYLLNMNHPLTTEILYTWPEMFEDPEGFFSREKYFSNFHRYGSDYYYFSEEQKNKRIKELEDSIDRQYDELVRICKEEQARDQQTRRPEIIRAFSTEIIKLTNCYVDKGYSPLDVLIEVTKSGKPSERGFEMVWNILDDAGFLRRKYVFPKQKST